MIIKQAITDKLKRSARGSDFLALRALSAHGHLRESGWFESVLKSMPVDVNQQPLPWYTYGAIQFVGGRTKPNMGVFEFGSGNSTLWWSQRVQRVVSCEHDSAWFEVMRGKLPTNVVYEFADRAPAGDYDRRIARFVDEFDVVVVDGRDRIACAKQAVPALKADGVIIWDNSDRPEYQEGYDHLLSHGFRRIDFWGMGPINTYAWCTSVFYRRDNCFDI